MSRILVLVPNTATKDRRVLRETLSLKNAGHEVEILGITTNDAAGNRAISDEGIRVSRVDWRAKTYLRTANTYLFKLILMVIVAATALLVASHYTMLVVPSVLKSILQSLLPNLSQNISGQGYNWLSIGVLIVSLIILVIGSRAFKSIIKRANMISELQRMRTTAENYDKIEKNSEESQTNKKGFWRFFTDGSEKSVSFKESIKVRSKEMIEYALEWKPDIIYCHEVMTLPVGTACKKQLGIPVIYDAHEVYDDLAHAEPYILETYVNLHKRHIKNVDLLIAVNPRILEYYINTYPGNYKTLVMPNTVWQDKGEDYDGRLHKAAGLESDKNILLYQGGFSMNRGLEHLVEAAYSLPDNWVLVLMGWGKIENDLITLIEEQKTLKVREYSQSLKKEFTSSSEFKEKVLQLKESIEENFSFVKAEKNSTNTDAATNGAMRLALFQRMIGMIMDENNTTKTLDIESLADQLREESEEDEEQLLSYDLVVEQFKEGLDVIMSKTTLEAMEKKYSGYLDKISIIGPAPHNELAKWTKGATVGMVPYLNTGLNHWLCSPNKLFEYPNAGVPILASRMKYLNEVINDNAIGWTMPSDFEPNDISDIISGLTDEEISKKSRNCRTFIDKHNYSKYEPAFIKTVESLIN